MKLSRFLFYIMLFQTIFLVGQEINGVVLIDDTKKPLFNLNIIHENSKNGTTTNEFGEFVLRGKFNEIDTLHFSHIGYSSKQITVKDFTNKEFTLFLSKETEQLNEVSVVSKKQNKLQSNLKFETLSNLKKGVYSFAAVALKDSILVIGGDESVLEDALKKRMIKDPTFGLLAFIHQDGGDVSWWHYSGKI